MTHNELKLELQSHSHSDQIKYLSSKLDRLIDYLNLEEKSEDVIEYGITDYGHIVETYNPHIVIKKYFTPKSGGKKK